MALCGKLEVRSSIGQQAQWPQSRKEDGFSGAEGLPRWLKLPQCGGMGGEMGGWEVRKVQITQAGACRPGRLANYHHQNPNKGHLRKEGVMRAHSVRV